MKALTLWPEWAWAILHLGKDVENRGWRLPPSLVGQWLALHAGKYIGGKPGNGGALIDVVHTAKAAGWDVRYMPRNEAVYIARDPYAVGFFLRPGIIVTSAIMALVRVTRVEPPGVGSSPWRSLDRWGWYLEVRPLPRPVPCKGAQGLWVVPADVEKLVNEQMESSNG